LPLDGNRTRWATSIRFSSLHRGVGNGFGSDAILQYPITVKADCLAADAWFGNKTTLSMAEESLMRIASSGWLNFKPASHSVKLAALM